jgi:hypothetical protein
LVWSRAVWRARRAPRFIATWPVRQFGETRSPPVAYANEKATAVGGSNSGVATPQAPRPVDLHCHHAGRIERSKTAPQALQEDPAWVSHQRSYRSAAQNGKRRGKLKQRRKHKLRGLRLGKLSPPNAISSMRASQQESPRLRSHRLKHKAKSPPLQRARTLSYRRRRLQHGWATPLLVLSRWRDYMHAADNPVKPT